MSQYHSTPQPEENTPENRAKLEHVKQFLRDLNSLPGRKHVTIVSDVWHDTDVVKFTVSAEMTAAKSVPQPLAQCLWDCFGHPNGIIVRQFLREKVNVGKRDGRRIRAPRQSVYGCTSVDGSFRWLTDEEMFEDYYTDFKTGNLRPAEPDVTCCGFYPDRTVLTGTGAGNG